MPNDAYYRTPHWARVKQFILARDHFTCTVYGCHAKAVVVDHIVSRAMGGLDEPNNLRSLCKLHDNQIKERPGGKQRGRSGEFVSICDMNGMPTDPNHPWYKRKTGG